MTFLGEASWEQFESNVELLLGFEGSPTWNKTLQKIPWELREDYEEGVEPDLTSYVLAYGAVFDWSGLAIDGEEIEFNHEAAYHVFRRIDWLRKDALERVRQIGRDVHNAKYGDAEIVAEYVKWELSYREMSDNQVRMKIKRGPLAGYALIDLKPELNSRQEVLLSAYQHLTMTRNGGMSGPLKMTVPEIIDAAESGIFSVPADVLVAVVSAADQSYLKWYQENRPSQ